MGTGGGNKFTDGYKNPSRHSIRVIVELASHIRQEVKPWDKTRLDPPDYIHEETQP